MDPEMDAETAVGHRIPSDVVGLDDGRTSYLPADVLRELNLEELEEGSMVLAAAGSPKAGKKKKTGSPKPGSPKPGSPKPGKPKKVGSPKR
jgi:hypothetical protein